MQELTFEQVEEVSGGVDLDWGSVWAEVGKGAVEAVGFTGVGIVSANWLLGAAIRLHPAVAIGVAGVGGAYSGYIEVVRQTSRIKKDT